MFLIYYWLDSIYFSFYFIGLLVNIVFVKNVLFFIGIFLVMMFVNDG